MILLLACLSACEKEGSPNVNDWTANRNSEAVTNDNNRNNEQQGDSTGSADQVVTNISINTIYDSIRDGIGEVDFEMNDKTYTGCFNSNGEIFFYYCCEEYEYSPILKLIGNGAGFVTIKKDYSTIEKYILFNEKGQKIMKSGDVFDKIIGYGDGLMLVYKNTSTITTEEHSYGVLDCNGNWVKPLTAGTELPVPYYASWSDYNYIGDGVFMARREVYSGYKYILFNSNTNKSYYIDYCNIYSDRLYNGVIYGRTRGGWYSTIYDYSGEYAYLPSYFAIHADGTFEEVPEFTYAYNNLLINTDGQYMRITDKSNNTEKEYTAFPSEMISKVLFEGDVGIVILSGADGKTYLSIIDKECNQKTEPIVCADSYFVSIVSISEDRIVYKNSDGIYEVIDVNGNTIVSADQGFTYIGEYSGGIAYAKNGDGESCLLGLDGKPLTIKLK